MMHTFFHGWRVTAVLLALMSIGCGPSSPPVKIIHVVNRHWVPKDSFAVDLRQSEPTLTDQQIEDRYATFLDDVEELQNEQSFNLRRLVRTHGLRSVFYEGVTDDDRELFETANGRIEVTEKLQKKMDVYDNSVEAFHEPIFKLESRHLPENKRTRWFSSLTQGEHRAILSYWSLTIPTSCSLPT